MKRMLSLGALLLAAACGSTSTVATLATPIALNSPTAQTAPRAPALESPSTGTGTRLPSPSPSPQPAVACKTGSSAGAMVMIGGVYGSNHLIYDVADPLRPRLICSVANTVAHLFTGDTFVYLKPVSPTETDVILHSIGSGNESKAASFPADVTNPFVHDIRDVAWTADGSLLAYAVPDETTYVVHVWVYSQGKAKLVHDYGLGIGDCVCRFGLPPSVLAFSPNGQYLVDGQLAGKGSTPVTILRVSDGSIVYTADPGTYAALWDRASDRLFLVGSGTYAWTPAGGATRLPGGAWQFLQGISPDDTQAVYTAYADPTTDLQPRVYMYDLKAGSTKLLIDKLRTQVLFVKDGWVWYLEERACTTADNCGGTLPTGNVFAMQLSTGIEQPVLFASGENPITQAGNWAFSPGEFWPNS